MTRTEITNLIEEAYNLPIRSKLPKFKEGHIFDEDKSVKWNREEVIRKNQEYEADTQKIKQVRKEAIDEAERKLQKFLIEEYEYFNLSSKQIQKLYNYAYEEYHSYGLSEILIHLDELVDLVSEVITLK